MKFILVMTILAAVGNNDRLSVVGVTTAEFDDLASCQAVIDYHHVLEGKRLGFIARCFPKGQKSAN